MKYIIVPITFLISGLVFSQENENNTQKDSVKNLKEVVISANQIIGSKFEAANKTGSIGVPPKNSSGRLQFTTFSPD